MTFIADIFLAAGAFGAAFYCFVLGKRLRAFNDLKQGMGGAVAVLSAQVDDLEKTLTSAQTSAAKSAAELVALTERAEDVRRQLEIQMASLHDIVPPPSEVKVAEPPEPQKPSQTEPMFVRHRANAG